MWYFVGFCGLALPCIGLTEKPVWPVDRYSYLLDVALVGGAGGALIVVANRFKRLWPIWLVLGLTLGVSATASRRLMPVWENTYTLFAHMERDPDFGSSVTQHAHIYFLWHLQLTQDGRWEEGQKKLAMAQEIYVVAMRQALSKGSYEDAVFLSRLLEKNISISAVIRRERAAWLFKLGQHTEGMKELRLAAVNLPGDERVKQLEQFYLQKTTAP